MATAKPTYLVTDKSDLHYAGGTKHALRGEIVDDLPGESIGWLKSDGYIVATVADPPTDPPVVVESPTAPISDLSGSSSEAD